MRHWSLTLMEWNPGEPTAKLLKTITRRDRQVAKNASLVHLD